MKNKYKVGSVVSGCVTGIEKYGIFVSLDDYYSGLIHISEISDSFVRNVEDYVKIGETIKVKILEIDDENCHIKLSIKKIDYRVSHTRRKKIVETKNGFNTLKIKLIEWINEKEQKMASKSKKNSNQY